MECGSAQSSRFSGRAAVWCELGDLEQALADCTNAIRLAPRSAEAYNNRGFMWTEKEDFEKALADFDACVAAGKCRRRHITCDEDGFAGSDPEQCDCTRGPREQSNPANCVTWQAASSYCTAQDKELPTREQWNWALHGGSITPDHAFPWGPKFLPKHACLGRSATCPVGQYASGQSPQGIRDLVGNVAEWTRDHAVNGSSFRDGDSVMDPDARERLDREAWSDSVGFRCIRLKP